MVKNESKKPVGGQGTFSYLSQISVIQLTGSSTDK